jgi:hypothetical protein
LGGSPTAKPKKLILKRRKPTTDEDLRKQLLDVPELTIDPRWISGATGSAVRAPSPSLPRPGAARLYVVNSYDDMLTALPGMRQGHDSELGKDRAEQLQMISKKLRAALNASIMKGSGDPRPDPARLREILLADKPGGWLVSEAIPAFQQLLMAEGKLLRALLVELLSQIPGKEASTALAQRALFDLSPDIREAAVAALRDRPAEEYRAVLLAGFRYPWPAAADHAAEALIALEDRAALERLVDLLKEPDPRIVPGVPEKGRVTAEPRLQELVRVNHLANCLLCHKPSNSPDDLLRAVVPVPGKALPTSASSLSEYEGTNGTFVRADITFLRQDFSVVQPVPTPGTWPSHQRYDYLLRTRTKDPTAGRTGCTNKENRYCMRCES